MISEKTAELNLTTELINWFFSRTKKVHFAIGPSLKQEAKLGFDVAVGGGAGVLIQYKRAYVNGSKWKWHLNRTKSRDQHLRLQNLEAHGIPVFYAFPHFSTIADIQAHRRKLLVKTFWFKPSAIMPTGGPTGHHDVVYDEATGSWAVHSEQPTEIGAPLTIFDIGKELEKHDEEGNLDKIIHSFDRIVLEIDPERQNKESVIMKGEVDDLVNGVALLGRQFT